MQGDPFRLRRLRQPLARCRRRAGAEKIAARVGGRARNVLSVCGWGRDCVGALQFLPVDEAVEQEQFSMRPFRRGDGRRPEEPRRPRRPRSG